MFAKPELHLFGTLPLLFYFFSLQAALAAVQISSCSGGEFVRIRGIQFVVDERVFYPNGFNAYWLMTKASEDASNNKEEVSVALRQATRLGLNVVRTWAFSDGGYKPLQYSPGSYDEAMFQVQYNTIHRQALPFGSLIDHRCQCMHARLGSGSGLIPENK